MATVHLIRRGGQQFQALVAVGFGTERDDEGAALDGTSASSFRHPQSGCDKVTNPMAVFTKVSYMRVYVRSKGANLDRTPSPLLIGYDDYLERWRWKMPSQWLQIEYYRLDCVETWEEGPRKQATRAAILNAIASLSRNGQGLPVYRSAKAN
jgi:hypothetical protein